jgi:hypothetical protein
MIWFDLPLPGQLFPMVRLHNSGKSSCGMPSHPQCASWFSHWHIIGSSEEPSLASLEVLQGEEPSLASLEVSQGVVLQLFGIARSSRMGYRWYVANVLIYAYMSHLLLGKGCVDCGCCLAVHQIQLRCCDSMISLGYWFVLLRNLPQEGSSDQI